jgi:serine/threonine protein kinase
MSTPENPTFGKYELLDRLAMGGMAELYRAQLKGAAGFSKDVVIKRIHPEMSDSPEFVRMFTNEAKIAALLNHPNIVQVTDFDCLDNTYYLAMEYIHGADLRRILTRADKKNLPLPFELILYIGSQLLRGLHYAHSFTKDGQPQHIVHRDMSPHNVMVSFKGEVKVTDFGIARIVQHASYTATGVIKGKLAYMAPEQTESSRVDHRADLFSVGVILWEMLCHQRLFAGENELVVLDKLRELNVPPPHTIDRTIPRELSDLICRALEREADERIPDARTFHRELLAFTQNSLDMEERLSQYMAELFKEPEQKPERGTALLDSWQPPSAAKSQKAPASNSPFPAARAKAVVAKVEEDTTTDPDVLRPTQKADAVGALNVALDEAELRTQDIRSPRSSSSSSQTPEKATATAQDALPNDPEDLATVEVNPRHYLSAAQFLQGERASEEVTLSSPEQLSTTEVDPRQYLAAHHLRVGQPQQAELPGSNLTGIARLALPPEAASPASTLPVMRGVSSEEAQQVVEELETREVMSPAAHHVTAPLDSFTPTEAYDSYTSEDSQPTEAFVSPERSLSSAMLAGIAVIVLLAAGVLVWLMTR